MDTGNFKILQRQTSNINLETGEVNVSEEVLRLKTKKREKFMLLYVENFNLIINLRKKTQEVLALILTKKVTYGTNEVVLDSPFRAELSQRLETSRQVIANTIAELVEKKILKREKKLGGYIYHLNPYIFGQGEWNTIEKQRQQFTIDYDFVNMTAKKEIKTITAYEGLPNKENIQVISREQYTDEAGIKHHNVLVEDKKENNTNIKSTNNLIANQSENVDFDKEIKNISFEEKKIELEILREKNRELELKNKNIELENERMRLTNGTLF
ncbi:hypothetical protein [Helicobacter sp. MIT 14-3879]|uniref:hypothetical protein n=1 Tax=Helicobacter sp. MIT 14-3879 TaxID=2040649 RepID=UPI000E1F037D|nr:hypothetical protein [Helicobacter sp. MIT 14-3879]RDU61870.1 hypothetical protein CQA44_08045 [Helicobacter sp. MIT 14-3879]